METVSRFFSPPRRSFFLFGPRGTGKSTWTLGALPDALRVDLLDPETARRLQARPERLMELVRALPEDREVVIDEVQKVPELLEVVHLLIEERPKTRFVLTGSSARKLRRTGVDLLAGRASLCTLHPFMAAELGRAFDLERALVQGMLPVVVADAEPAEVLRSYVALYVREEVQAEALVRNVGAFSRFLEAVSFSHGSLLNVSDVARDCGIERKTVAGYLEILVDLLLGFRLPVFRRRARRATTVHPKFYLADCGVFRSLRPAGPLDRPAEIDGAALEGLVVQHLRAWNAYDGERHDLAFWRTRGGSEVDVVVHGPLGFWAIEVKRSGEVRARDLRGLRAFREDYPECTPLLLYCGSETLVRGGVTCLPVEEFLSTLRPGVVLSHSTPSDTLRSPGTS